MGDVVKNYKFYKIFIGPKFGGFTNNKMMTRIQ